MTMTKLLLLHGYMQSDRIINAKTGALRKALKKLNITVASPCAPFPVYSEDYTEDLALMKEASEQPEKFGWWKKAQSDPLSSYTIPDETKKLLKDFVLEHGPFDGIAGFSQGGGLAGYLATDLPGILGVPQEHQPKFLISFSGFRLEPTLLVEQYKKHPIAVPSLHVLGEMDYVVDESRALKLFDECQEKDRTLLRHSGGHVVPNSKVYVQQLCAWIANNVEGIELPLSSTASSTTSLNSKTPQSKPARQENKKIDNKKPDLDSDLLDMIDNLGKL